CTLLHRAFHAPLGNVVHTGASHADTENAIAAARQGQTIVFFPEGAFTRRAGLSEFYLGAFKVAAEAGLPVVPGAIRGTRTMLRADQWFPRRTSVSVTIENPILPSGKDFASLLRLRGRSLSTSSIEANFTPLCGRR